ncbi:hypothetical protein FQN55_001654 [Onygenales sp. PD_40]|nr:hypothetical protein FQN55_001654 [Onygenales sp. PD_40]
MAADMELPSSTPLLNLPIVAAVGGAILALLVAVLAATLIPLALASSRPKNFPPGPPTVPVLGNLHLIPRTKAFVLFTEWRKKYGSIIGLKFGGSNFVILNSYQDVQELLEKRSSIYSSRPPNYIANTLICPDDVHMLFAPYGPSWRAVRKAVQALFAPREISNLLPIQDAESTQTLYDILRDPESSYQHIQRVTTAIILASVFGQRGEKFESPKVQALYDVQYRFTALCEAGGAVDVFPFLKYMPGIFAPWKKAAREIRRDHRALYLRLKGETEERLRQGRFTGCFMEKVIENKEKNGLSDEQIVYMGGSMMEAGSDTTSSTLLSFMLGMLQNQEALKRAQVEVDRCCGTDRLPSPKDLGSLPYIEACMNEALRWRPVVPGGVPHMLTETDTYKGYVFPAGTIFLINAWAIQHNEDDYFEPDKYNPDRWLNNKYGTISNDTTAAYESEQRKLTYGFGAGRRICSGQRLAENSLRLIISKLVWAFDFDSGGEEIDTSPQTGYKGGFAIAPLKYPIRIRPRSEKHASVVKREFEKLGSFFEKFESI